MDLQKDLKAIVKVEEELIAGDVSLHFQFRFQNWRCAQIDLNETPARYAAFLGRLRPIVVPASRYLAYTSDLGESFRPIVPPSFVTATYAISIMYLLGDVSYEGYKANKSAKEASLNNSAIQMVTGISLAKRAVFQGLASMLFPALTIHSVVKYSAQAIRKSTKPIFMKPSVRAWLPTFLGLAVVPALPFMFDEPGEIVVEKIFDWGEAQFIEDESVKKALKAKDHHTEL